MTAPNTAIEPRMSARLIATMLGRELFNDFFHTATGFMGALFKGGRTWAGQASALMR
jgi:hypothetical protein